MYGILLAWRIIVMLRTLELVLSASFMIGLSASVRLAPRSARFFFAPLGREVPNLSLGIEEPITLAFCDHDVAKAWQRLNQATVDETADRCDGKAQVIRSFWG